MEDEKLEHDLNILREVAEDKPKNKNAEVKVEKKEGIPDD